MSRYLAGAFALLITFPAMAESPSYNFIQASYESVDLDAGGGLNVDGDGWGLGGSFEIDDRFFGFAGYSDLGFDLSVDLTQWQAGLGWHTGISDTTDFFATAAYIDAKIDAPGFSSLDESGYGIGVGIRSNVSELIELYGEISYADLGSGSGTTAFGGGIYFNLAPNFALGIGASTDEDVTSYGATARFYFGK